MSDSTRPPDEDPSRQPHAHPTLREEIAEVVEHVPQPVRWTVGKLVRLVLLSLFALIVVLVVSVGLYLSNRTRWVAQEIALVVNQALARHSDVTLSMKDIRGNPLSGFHVIEPSLRFRGRGAPPLLEARDLRIAYSLWGVVTGSSRAIDVDVDHPVIRIARAADGSLRLPRWEGGPSRGGKNEPLRLHLRLHDARVAMPDTALDVLGANLDVVAQTSPARVDVAKLSWTRGPYGARLDGMRAHAEFGDSVRVRLTDLRSPDLEISAGVTWPATGGPTTLTANVTRVRWKLLARVFDNKTMDVPGFGRVDLVARGSKDWQGKFGASVDWDALIGSGSGEFHFKDGQLAIVPLKFQSAAGNLVGRLEWSERGWDLSGDVTRGNPEKWGTLHITGWPAGKLNGWFRYAEDTREHGSGRLEARLGRSEIEAWQVDSAWVRVDFPEIEPDSFTVRMARRGGHMWLHGHTTDSGWRGDYELENYALDEWDEGRKSGLAGRVTHGTGTVEDRDEGLFVTGRLEGEHTDWIGIHAGRWRVPELRGRLLPTPDLDMPLMLGDASCLGVHFDSVAAGLRVGDGTVALDSVRALAADTTLTLAGLSTSGEKGWTLHLDRARATSSQFDWVSDGPMELRGDAKQVWFDRLAARDGSSRLEVHGAWASSGGVYDWRASARDLDLTRLGLPRDWQLSGHVNADLQVDGASGDPRWTLTASARSPGKSGHAADSLGLELAGSRGRLEVRRFEGGVRQGYFASSALARGMSRDWPDTLTGEGVLSWIATAREWQGRLDVHDLPLDRLGGLMAPAVGVAGVLNGSITFSGTPASPAFETSAIVRPAVWKGYGADQIDLRASFAERRLAVSELKITRGAVVSRIHGEMPLDLALANPVVVPDLPMRWTIEAPNGDLGIVPQFVPQVGFAAGRFDVTTTLGGTTHHPVIDGKVRIRDGRVRLAAREELLEGLSADFHIESSGITLDSLTARQGDRGRVHAHGRVDLDGFALKAYRFDLALRDFAASDAGLYAALFDGDFVVTNGPRVSGETLPMVAGTARMKRAAILFDFSNQSELQQIAAATQPLFWTYRIQLEATDHVNWRPPEGDIEFNADLRLEQTRDSLLIYGEMHALRGTYWFLSNKFDIQTVDLTFDNVEGANAQIDATATTQVAPTQEAPSSTGGTQTNLSPHVIGVHIKGRTNRPVIEFTDQEPAPNSWDQERILREITYGRFVGRNNAFTPGDPLDNFVTRAINRSLSADLSKAFGGYVNEWSLERDRGGLFGGEGDVVVSAAGQITNRLSLRYSQRLPGFSRDIQTTITAPSTNLFEREVRAEFRLNRFFFVSTDISQRRATSGSGASISAGPEYNVNLKARWEY